MAGSDARPRRLSVRTAGVSDRERRREQNADGPAPRPRVLAAADLAELTGFPAFLEEAARHLLHHFPALATGWVPRPTLW
jgi:hypothetical protein